uniref:Uncharacterized protein n=1 Tax=Nelumbo nucifera TaxID=4432 RepID=A0A822Z4Y6_NELNU|nr:TPA_asm: hypothetical protein HUJ06_014455 [Nelumbo nucifera]
MIFEGKTPMVSVAMCSNQRPEEHLASLTRTATSLPKTLWFVGFPHRRYRESETCCELSQRRMLMAWPSTSSHAAMQRTICTRLPSRKKGLAYGFVDLDGVFEETTLLRA